jgi:hypothetical protein
MIPALVGLAEALITGCDPWAVYKWSVHGGVSRLHPLDATVLSLIQMCLHSSANRSAYAVKSPPCTSGLTERQIGKRHGLS